VITGIIPRLESETGSTFKLTGSAIEFAEIVQQPPQRHQLPAAYVMPLTERAERNTRVTQVVSQRNTVTFTSKAPLEDMVGTANALTGYLERHGLARACRGARAVYGDRAVSAHVERRNVFGFLVFERGHDGTYQRQCIGA